MNFEWRPLVSYPKAPTSVRWSGSHAAGLWWGVLDGVIRGSGLVVVVVVVGGSHPESCRNVVRSFNPLRWLEGDITSPGHGTLSAWTIWRFCPTQCRISPLLLLLFSFPLLLSPARSLPLHAPGENVTFSFQAHLQTVRCSSLILRAKMK